jgi:predicted O-methyltransferase YrrM
MDLALQRAHWVRRELAFLLQLRVLPPPVAVFQARARWLALRAGDEFGPIAATRPAKLAALLSLAQNKLRVAELGTAAGWTAISLLLSDPRRSVVSYDVVHRPQLDLYLKLAGPDVRRRLALVCAPGDQGPGSVDQVDLLYVDSSHELAQTIREVRAWWPVLADGAVVVFDDYTHPEYPGVREAVAQLGLDGEEREGFFLHRFVAAPQSSTVRG